MLSVTQLGFPTVRPFVNTAVVVVIHALLIHLKTLHSTLTCIPAFTTTLLFCLIMSDTSGIAGTDRSRGNLLLLCRMCSILSSYIKPDSPYLLSLLGAVQQIRLSLEEFSGADVLELVGDLLERSLDDLTPPVLLCELSATEGCLWSLCSQQASAQVDESPNLLQLPSLCLPQDNAWYFLLNSTPLRHTNVPPLLTTESDTENDYNLTAIAARWSWMRHWLRSSKNARPSSRLDLTSPSVRDASPVKGKGGMLALTTEQLNIKSRPQRKKAPKSTEGRGKNVIVDGSNVAMTHGLNLTRVRSFSSAGIVAVVDFYKDRSFNVSSFHSESAADTNTFRSSL